MIMSMNDDLKNHQDSQKTGALGFVEKSLEPIEASINYVKQILEENVEAVIDNPPHRIFNTRNLNY